MSSMLYLDTHVLVWMVERSPKLGTVTQKMIADALKRRELGFSAYVFWEAALLAQHGRLELRQPLSLLRQALLDFGITEEPVNGIIGVDAAELANGFHKDPADRIIVATALRSQAVLLTADEKILAWKGPLERHNARK